jgi:hypothetical protein
MRAHGVVVDASVARASSDGAVTPAPQCVAALEAILSGGAFVLQFEEIQVEWRRHGSRYFARWVTRAYGARRMARCVLGTLAVLSDRLKAAAGREDDARAMTKDAHLVAAGIEHGGRILSLDEAARRLFAGVGGRLGDVGGVHWANPAVAEERVVEWLRAGAPADDSRRLTSGENGPIH